MEALARPERPGRKGRSGALAPQARKALVEASVLLGHKAPSGVPGLRGRPRPCRDRLALKAHLAVSARPERPGHKALLGASGQLAHRERVGVLVLPGHRERSEV